MPSYFLPLSPTPVQRWLVFEPPAHPLRSQQSLRLSSDYLMLSCAILPCSDVSAWLPNTLDAVSVDPTQSLAVLVGNVFRSRDSASGTVLLGPATVSLHAVSMYIVFIVHSVSTSGHVYEDLDRRVPARLQWLWPMCLCSVSFSSICLVVSPFHLRLNTLAVGCPALCGVWSGSGSTVPPFVR